MKKVLFVCTHNSARSQMAEAWLRRYGGEEVEVESAGLRLHWSFDDPSGFTGSDGQVMARVREVRDAVRERVRRLAGELRGA